MTTNIQSFSGDVEIAGNLSVPSGITGVASSATKLQTARNIFVSGAVTGSVGFDGTTSVNIFTTSSDSATASRLQTARNIGGVSFDGTADINLPGVDITGTQDTSGNSATATSLQTARNIELTGDVTGTASFDGSTNISIATTSVGGGFDPSTVNPIAIGVDAGETNQGIGSVAIGTSVGRYNQKSTSVAIGQFAGNTSQAVRSIAVGYLSGRYNQKSQSVAIGPYSGSINQSVASLAIGSAAGRSNQSSYSVAIGLYAGQYNQGSFCIGMGFDGGAQSQPNGSFYVSKNSMRNQSGTYYMRYNTSTGEVSYTSSDDRVKDDETVITGAVKTLSKLRPQNYLKRTKLDPYAPEQNWNLESGLMAQEVYYSAPELRHIVGVPPEAGDIEKYTPPPSDDPTQDPDYSVWGDGIATVDYMQMVPYLVKAVQEIVTELPRSKTTVSNTWGQNITGCVVSANTNSHKTNTTPIVALSNVYMDKAWYGVVSVQKTDTNDYDTLVNTNGDTQIWVTDVGGSLESGDLVTTSNVAPGYTQKQCDDLLRSSTVAKVTQDCDFTEPMRHAIKIPKRELSNVTYYAHDESYEIGLYDYERRSSFTTRVDETPIYFKEVVKDSDLHTITRYYEGETEVSEMKYNTLSGGDTSVKHLSEISVEDYNTLDDIEKATYSMGTSKKYISIKMSKSKKQIPQHDEEIVVQELVDVFDENGQIVWEETGETEPMYTLVDHGTYKAALVSAKLV